MESKAVYLGYTTSKRLQLRQADLSRFGVARLCLFIQLPQSTAVKAPSPVVYHLVLILSDEGFRFALISVKMDSEVVSNTLAIEELGWLNKVPPNSNLLPKESAWGIAINGRPLSFGFDLILEDLRDLYDYSVSVVFHHYSLPLLTLLL